MPRLKLFRVCFWCLTGAVLFVSLIPSGGVPSVFPWDKFNHAVAFFVLSAAARLLWPRSRTGVLVLLLLFFGAAIEFLQMTMALGRQAEWMDFVADVVGTAAGLLLGHVLLRSWGKRYPAD